jgi:hypothetical protein
MRRATLYRRPPILRGVSASQIRADHLIEDRPFVKSRRSLVIDMTAAFKTGQQIGYHEPEGYEYERIHRC